jgi:hypothetical protein
MVYNSLISVLLNSSLFLTLNALVQLILDLIRARVRITQEALSLETIE